MSNPEESTNNVKTEPNRVNPNQQGLDSIRDDQPESESGETDEIKEEKVSDQTKSNLDDSEGKQQQYNPLDEVGKKRPRDATITNASFLKSTLETVTPSMDQTDFSKSIILTLQELVTIRNELSTLLEEEEQRGAVFNDIIPKLSQIDDLKSELEKTNPILLVSKKSKFEDDKKYDKNKICGVLNSRQKPCQRTGFCPFHGGRKQQEQKEEEDQNTVEEEDWEEDWPEDATKEQILEAKQVDKDYLMTVSVLLIAAAALEKEQLERQNDKNATTATDNVTSPNSSMKL